MIVQLLLFTCACALGTAHEAVPFEDTVQSVLVAQRMVNENVLSMDGNIPPVDDPRRHYAVILYVIHHAALQSKKCLEYKYFDDYQRNVNKSVDFALSNPQGVVDVFKKIHTVMGKRLEKIPQLIEAAKRVSENYYEYEDDYDAQTIKPVENYELAWDLLTAAGSFARQLLQHEDYFDSLTKNQSVQHFLITEVRKIKKLVDALGAVYQILYHPLLRIHC